MCIRDRAGGVESGAERAERDGINHGVRDSLKLAGLLDDQVGMQGAGRLDRAKNGDDVARAGTDLGQRLHQIGDGAASVSYTHLDVYKRQLLSDASRIHTDTPRSSISE